MNALSNATAIALLTTAATVANAQTQGQIPPQTRSDTTDAPSLYQSRAASINATSVANNANAIGPGPSRGEAIGNVPTPTAFAATVAQAGMTEVALAGLALRKSSNDRVKQFALRIVQDHGQVNQELDSIVKQKGLILPTSLEAKYNSAILSLDAKSGAAFDKAYIKHIAHDHSAAISLFELASRSSDADIAAFAWKTLPTLQEHKLLADELQASTGIQTASAL